MDDMEVIVFEDLPSEKTPIDADNLNKMQENAKKAIKNRKPTIELLTVSSAAPLTCAVGDKYYNTTTSKIYTAIATNTWGTEGENPTSLYLYVDLEHKELYYFNGTTFVSYGGGSGGAGGDTLPIGGIIAFDSDTIPNGWLLCDGRAVSRTKYAELFKAIGTKHGSGDGSTTFNLPNPKGRTLVGKDSSDTDFSELGKTGEGTAKDKIKLAGTYYGLVDTKIVSGTGYGGQGLVSVTKNTSESAQSLDNNGIDFMPPYLVTNFIIKAKNTAVVKGDVIQEDGTASETNVYSAKAIDNKLKTNITTGQEIATNEYIDGKRVYFTRISINEFPGDNVTINHNINNIYEIIDYDATFALATGETRKMPGLWKTDYSNFLSTVYQVTKKTMQLVFGSFWTSGTFKKAVITIKYTKNT